MNIASIINPVSRRPLLGLVRMLNGKADWHALIGGSLAVVGTLLLTADKGALGIVPGALESLPDQQFTQAMPVVEAIFTKAGPLVLLYFLLLLMIGVAILGVGLLKVPTVPRWKSAAMVITFLMFLNPDIDIISAIASVVLLIGLGSIGLDFLRGEKVKGNSHENTIFAQVSTELLSIDCSRSCRGSALGFPFAGRMAVRRLLAGYPTDPGLW